MAEWNCGAPLLPPLPQCIESSFCKILRDHGDSESTAGVEFKEERLRKRRDPRLIGDIDNENCAAVPCSSTKYAASGLSWARISWMIAPAVPERTRLLKGSLGNDAVSIMRMTVLLGV